MVHWFKSRHTGNTVQCERPERHSQAHGFVANASTMPEIFEPEDAQRMGKARSAQRQTWVFTALAIICAIAGCAIIGYPYALQFIDHQRQARLAAEVVNQVDGWPYPKKAKEALAAARAYNKQLAEGGQGTLASALILLPRMPASPPRTMTMIPPPQEMPRIWVCSTLRTTGLWAPLPFRKYRLTCRFITAPAPVHSPGVRPPLRRVAARRRYEHACGAHRSSRHGQCPDVCAHRRVEGWRGFLYQDHGGDACLPD